MADGGSSLPQHCHPTNSFLVAFSTLFATCVPTPLAFLSTALGMLSIVAWLFAQLPQIYKNYRLSSTAGLSPFFLLKWCLGDMSNLLGAVFTVQATWQIVIAAYYCFVDVVLVLQWAWYRHIRRRRRRRAQVHRARTDDVHNSVDGTAGDASNKGKARARARPVSERKYPLLLHAASKHVLLSSSPMSTTEISSEAGTPTPGLQPFPDWITSRQVRDEEQADHEEDRREPGEDITRHTPRDDQPTTSRDPVQSLDDEQEPAAICDSRDENVAKAIDDAPPQPPSWARYKAALQSHLWPPPPYIIISLIITCALTSYGPLKARRNHPPSTGPAPSPNVSMTATAQPDSDPSTVAALGVGTFFAWLSTLLYLGSRLPQLWKNARRRSTTGLSLSLFVAAFFGNAFYASSLLTNPYAWYTYPPHGGHGWAGPAGSNRADWVVRALPFWLGAAGVLSLDAAVGVQFWLYNTPNAIAALRAKDSSTADETLLAEADRHDESRSLLRAGAAEDYGSTA